jgi:OOP family OmpA-OmpF porin
MALDKTGRVALYVNFDFAKAALQPDAAPVIAQVVKLLQDNPALKLSIEGHTDNVGGDEYNKKLSSARAAAVAAVAGQGIAKDRLTSRGFGAENPIADNGSGDGRAKNRRVELVKR